MVFRFEYLNDAPIIDVNAIPQLEGNANGPTLIKIPDWVSSPQARYYLYFAHHEGKSIRLAFADELTGPWRLSDTPALHLTDSLFYTTPPQAENLAEEARQFIDKGYDGYYPHIASPDIYVDHDNRQIRLYYHGRLQNGLQRTRVAISSDGLNFKAQPEILGQSYFRLFKQNDYFYALASPGHLILYRSRNGIDTFEAGPELTSEPIRHFALHFYEARWHIFYSRAEDSPERIFRSTLATDGHWQDWRIEADEIEVHRPQRGWEGADQPPQLSKFGSAMSPVNQLRDPYVFEESGRLYLLYSVAGEQGIGLGELIPVADD